MNNSELSKFMSATGSDAVGGVTQVALNSYSTQHYKTFPDTYKGDGDDKDLDLKYHFQISGGIVFTLTKIPTGADNLKRAVLADPLFHAQKPLFKATLDEPVVTVELPQTTVQFWTESSGEHLADVKITAKVSVGVVVKPGAQSSYSLLVVDVEINTESKKIVPDADRYMTAGCDINKLIDHILNKVLAAQLSRFLQSYPLPQPNMTVSGVALALGSVDVQDQTLLLGMMMRPAQVAGMEEVGSLNKDQAEGFEIAMFGTPIPRESSGLSRSKDGVQSTEKLRLDKVSRAVPKAMKDLPFTALVKESLPAGDIFVALSNNIFQALANKSVNILKEYEHDSGGWAHYWYKYFYKVWNPITKIIDSGLEISADMEGSASGGAGVSGCSSFISVELGADVKAVPRVTANAKLTSANSGKEVWLWPFAFPFVVEANAWIKPDVGVLDFLLSVIASGVLSFFSAIVLPLLSLALQFKLITLPDHVPGTPVPMKPSIAQIGNWNGLLFIGVKISY